MERWTERWKGAADGWHPRTHPAIPGDAGKQLLVVCVVCVGLRRHPRSKLKRANAVWVPLALTQHFGACRCKRRV